MRSAKTIVTLLGPSVGPNLDYAAKFWGGLLKDYYKKRWEMWYGAVYQALVLGQQFNQTAWAADDGPCAAFEEAWTREVDTVYPTEATGDILTIARGLHARFIVPEQPLPPTPDPPADCHDQGMCGGSNPAPPPPIVCSVISGKMTVRLLANGMIDSIRVNNNTRPFRGIGGLSWSGTSVTGAEQVGPTIWERTVGNGCRFERRLHHHNGTLLAVDHFFPVQPRKGRVGRVGWNLTLNGTSPVAWTAPVVLQLGLQGKTPDMLWSPWGKGSPLGNTTSPLQPQRFETINPSDGAVGIWDFGGNCQRGQNWGSYIPYGERVISRGGIPGLPGRASGIISCWHPGGISIPMASFLDTTSDTGVAFAFAPRNLLEMQLRAFSNKSVTFTTGASDPRGRLDVDWSPVDPLSPVTRPGYRFSPHTPLHLEIDIFGATGDTRDILGSYRDAHTQYFVPKGAAIHGISGLSTYTSFDATSAKSADLQRLKGLGYKLNWDAHFWFPYHGEKCKQKAFDISYFLFLDGCRLASPSSQFSIHPSCPSEQHVLRWLW